MVISNNNFKQQNGINYMNPMQRIGNSQPARDNARVKPEANGEFGSILQQKLQGNSELKFSKHAELRMQMRNIHLSQDQREKIGQAVKKAEEKGVKDSLVIMNDVAFVVNIKNKTVITAANSNELKESVFTNIDGAVFA